MKKNFNSNDLKLLQILQIPIFYNSCIIFNDLKKFANKKQMTQKITKIVKL